MNRIGKTPIESLPYKVTLKGSAEIHQYHQYFFSRLNAPSPWHPDHAALNPFPKKALGGECWCSALGALLATPLSPYHSWAFTFLFLISQLLCCLIMSLWLSGTLRHLLLQINFCHQINSFVARVYPYLSRSTSSQCQPDGIFWNLILLSREMSANMFSSSQRQWLCMRVCVCVCTLSRVQLFGTPWTIAHRLLGPWDSPDKNTGMGCHFLLQGIFPTQGSNSCILCLLHWQVDSWPFSHLGRQCFFIVFATFIRTCALDNSPACCPEFWTDVCFPGPNRVGHLLSFLMIYSFIYLFIFAMPLVACKASLTSNRTCAPSIGSEES